MISETRLDLDRYIYVTAGRVLVLMLTLVKKLVIPDVILQRIQFNVKTLI